LGALLECLFSDGLVAQELLPAGEIGFGKRQVGARQLEIGTRLIESDLEGPMVRLTGLAIVTAGGGGAAAFWLSLQPARATANISQAAV
jgi:hypothetical protein